MHSPHQHAGARAQSRSPAGRAHAVGHRHGAVGSFGAHAGRAGVDAARVPQSVSQAAVRLGAVRRRRGRHPRQGASDPRARVPRGKVRVGPLRRGLGEGRRRSRDGGARGARTGGPAAGRCRHCVGRRRGARRAIAAGADRGQGDVARGAVPARSRPTRGCRENPARCGSRVARVRTTSGWRGK